MEIEAGDIVCLVGPSGCGKTTTMRMINRLIEPTSGTILIGDDDVLKLKATELRRRIGYVIQQIGLFPHMTISQNVALVPGLLGWDKKETSSRVEELLNLVGLEPGRYADRYPRQLSGGQQQRVGVARALAADPPIMLMDEPFGAVDPITRVKLQDEFLNLQKQLRKTIVFVTHDFDEAVKMGDKIAVLREGSRIAQYDTPAAVLAAPADEFVAGFVGRGAKLKQLNLQQLEDQDLRRPGSGTDLPRIDIERTLHDALDSMMGYGVDELSVTRGRDVVGIITLDMIKGEIRELQERAGGRTTDTTAADPAGSGS
ncbi:ABC transporter ATP-binding protein [Nocardioidaceae bacterium]|nr:ABC transporter ATP-binding protein [Nocardioidaceae bacterium]